MYSLVLLIVAVCAYLMPIGMIIRSRRTVGHEKNLWLIAALIFSWVALLLYLTVVPKHRAAQQTKAKQRRH
ncbi:hypothetical protein ACFOEE_20445 [Pseudoalteromonas fenneropenaei]|uniref:Cardiolipin synthase N-terminal domain-containing protein n=1 Tax=Pseudoalteromonas fenneropenaei TaxID=1737459 RepID=A0ABV7CQS7_9GAMM